jgi:hypothetical protein
MRKAAEAIGWLVIGLLLGGLFAFSINALAADPIVTESTNSNTNRNYNTNNSTSYNYDQSSVKSDSTVRTDGSMTTTVKSPPPSAIAPQFSAGNGNDLCTVGASGAVQTQILGISVGSTFTEDNCIRLKNAKTLYDMGMKVAAVSVMCQDQKVFDAMMQAGTPCPYDGKIGQEAKLAWQAHTADEPKEENLDDVESKRLKALGIVGSIVGGFLLF